MNSVTLKIDEKPVTVAEGATVLSAARTLGLNIPTLCYLEKCGPLNTCLVCLVKINGKLVPSCGTKVEPGMIVESETSEVHEARRTALELLFSDHVGDCLAPCHRLCPLQMNIPEMLRQIKAGNLNAAGSIIKDALPFPGILGRLCHHPCEQGCRRGTFDEPAAIRDLEKMVSDEDLQVDEPPLPTRKPSTGKSVVIVGAGPAGLSAAWKLLREGHSCTIADRHESPGGSLRYSTTDKELPRLVLESELYQLERLGAVYKSNIALGTDLTLDGLLRGSDAVLIATGEITKAEGDAIGLEVVSTGIKVNPETFQTARPAVFAAGRVIRPINQLIRAMSEGVAAAQCIHEFLVGQKIKRPDKPFSSIMGRVEPHELNIFLQHAELSGRLKPRDPCSACAIKKKEGSIEASRCLHCDCHSSGNCALQTYAQIYGADASRYRQKRKKFEQHFQPGGIIFEPGKCILCGICVKLTELAQEPLGLTFIGRGFDVRVAAPFDKTITDGLQKVGAECVEHCPTGALTFEESGRTDLSSANANARQIQSR